jgi:hypothetical protein
MGGDDHVMAVNPDVVRVISARHGQVQPSGSWLYVWLDRGEGSVVYVGATSFDPELRAHLHLTSEAPEIGRVRATVPRYDERDFDILAFSLPASLPRSIAKQALSDALGAAANNSPAEAENGLLRGVIDEAVATVRAHLQVTAARKRASD